MTSAEHRFAYPAYVLFFTMLVYPMVSVFSYFNVFLFGLILIFIVIVVFQTGEFGLHPSVTLWALFLSFLSFLFVLEGFFRGGPGAGRMLEIYVAWPLIYILVLAGVRNEQILAGLTKTVTASTICVGVYSIIYLLAQTNVLPQGRYVDLISLGWSSEAFGLHEDYIGMNFPGLNSMFFLLPFSLAFLVTSDDYCAGIQFGRRLWSWLAIILGSVSTLLSGRRALYLVTLTSTALTLLFIHFQPRRQRRVSKQMLVRVAVFSALAISTLLISLDVTYGESVAGLVDRFSVGFDFSPTSADEGTTQRRDQYHALLAGWVDRPLFGAGHGTSAYGSIRSSDSPWNYELYYVALLYQTGLLGFVAYAAGILWIYWKGIQVIQAGGHLSAVMIANLVGMTSVLLASATNPYLARYDAMWVIFLPLAVINFWLLHRRAAIKVA